MEDDTLGQLLALTDDLEHQLATLRAHLASNPDADDGVKEVCCDCGIPGAEQGSDPLVPTQINFGSSPLLAAAAVVLFL